MSGKVPAYLILILAIAGCALVSRHRENVLGSVRKQ
jgi:hypothetical protein